MSTTALRSEPRRPRRLPDAVSVLANRDFRVVWIGQAISMTGTWAQAIAQGLVVLAIWNSPAALGTMNFANAVPTLAVVLFGGVLADRADKRRILLATQVTMAGLALLVGILVATHLATIWALVAATMVLGVALGYDMPAYSAYLPELVPPQEISQVVALNSATFHGSRMVGPAIAGVVIAAVGLASAYFINAASFAAVIIGLLIVRHRPAPRPVAAERTSAVADLKAGIAHVRGRPNLQALLMLTAITTIFVFPSLAILSPYYAKGVLHRGAGVLGLLWACSGVGSVLGAMALVWWPRTGRTLRIVFGALVGPAGMAGMAITRSVPVALVAFSMVSFSFASQLGLVQTMIQESTPAEFRGRVMSLHGVTFNGTIPFAGLASSWIAAAVGLPTVIAASAVLATLGSTLVLLFAGGGIRRVVRDSHSEFEAVGGRRGGSAPREARECADPPSG